MSKISVDLHSIGKCQHCSQLFTVKDFPADAMNAAWACPTCGGVIDGLSFGYFEEDRGKKQCIGPNGEWTAKEPEQGFELGNWSVITPAEARNAAQYQHLI